MTKTKTKSKPVHAVRSDSTARTNTVRAVRYGLTKNLGNYESERLDVEIVVAPNESFEAAVKRARAMCLRGMQNTERRRKARKAREVLKQHGIKPEDVSYIPEDDGDNEREDWWDEE